ncbi:restriction endonuclease subunit S [Limosilactobacillus mucosae]|nr:restriction endonuclease subunit S [Limosilactobacillus mucosae]MDC2836534.1 restriction endonuclease subunit S [Limosilactobacillus mucosae]MDC2853268.1 restriction endonuclease subunit S [Limosilactobacillus mucosae]
MFADETGYPILRFKGFSDAWEQRRLKNVAKSNIGGGTPKTSVKEYWGGTLPWIQSSDLIEGELFDVHVKKHITEIGIKNSAAKLIPKNSIAVVTRVGVGKLAFLPFEYATSQDFLSLNGVTGNPRFITYALQLAIKKLVRQLQGTSIKGITKSELLKILIKVPLEMAEQEKVSNLLLSTDSLITFHQHKIDNLKRLKRALLQKMFV